MNALPFSEPFPTLDSAPLPLERRRSYGLRFQSDFALPELALDEAGQGQADVRIEVGAPILSEEVALLNAPDAPLEGVMRFEKGWCQLLFSEVGRYTLRGGRHVLVEPLEGTSESSWRLPLLGTVMALLLEQRGLLALHGGAARFQNGGAEEVAAGFLGDKGQGKSTLNAALSQAGFALLCDDVLACDFNAGSAPRALSGFAWLKLLPDAVRGVWNAPPEAFDLVAPETELAKRSVPALLAPEPLPLRHLFILSSLPDDAPEPLALRRMEAQESLAHLISHTFAARFGALYLKGEGQKTYFRACSRLASECQVWQLSRKRDLALLPQTIAAIEKVVREKVVREDVVRDNAAYSSASEASAQS